MAASTTVLDSQNQAVPITPINVTCMLEACSSGDMETVQQLVQQNPVYASQQDERTGQSPLMVASGVGNFHLVKFLLEAGAPWNAVDRQGKCAGNYAIDAEKYDVSNLLVEWGTQCELILGAAQRSQRQGEASNESSLDHHNHQQLKLPESHQPSTKPDYLSQPLRYSDDGKTLLDAQKDAVMMQWEEPLMKAHAEIMMTDNQSYKKRVLNVGFGLGIIDNALQEYGPSLHVIIEAHPQVYQHMLAQKWDQKENVRICFGRWQEVTKQLIAEGLQFDAIFFDTYAEHIMDMEDFHQTMVKMLSKPNGIYSFFNGLAPDNIFFHGVACQCIKLQLQQLGLDSEFLPCQIQVDENAWNGVRRKYWHGRDTYYLPRVTWNPQALHGTIVAEEHEGKNKASPSKQDNDIVEMEVEAKRPRIDG